MKRRAFVKLLSGATVWSLVEHAQAAERIRRIAILHGGNASDVQAPPAFAAFERGLDELGWSAGRNIAIDRRFAGADPERMRSLAKELVETRPDLIVGHTTPVVAALQRESRTIPIVFVVVSDPVGSGFVASLPRPGGNITGFINLEASLGSKWIELLREIVPQLARPALMFNAETAPHWPYYLQPFEDAARSVALEPVTARVGTTDDIERFMTRFAQAPNGGLVLMPDIFVTRKDNLELIVALAERYRLPTIYPYRYMIKVGGLVSYGIDNFDLWRRAPAYVDRILKGASPAELPVQLPTKFELAVNLKTAKTLGIEIPPTLVARADEVIE